jgi:large conductance mechanosensitive channel
MKKHLKGFTDFIREQGVVGLAIGFILGGSVAKVVSSMVNDIINPLIGIVLGATSGLKEAYWQLGSAKVMWGSFVSVSIDFIVVALVVYFGVKLLGLDKLDKKKEKEEEKKEKAEKKGAKKK